jgi:hypothetical protein
MFAGLDITGSGAKTREQLEWKSTGPGLVVDPENMRYSLVKR